LFTLSILCVWLTFGSITTHAAPNPSRQISQTNANEVANIANKSAYATVAPGIKSSPSTFQPAAKFRVPFDEGPSTSDPVVQVDSLAESVQKERGYQIIGKVKAPTGELMKILAVGNLRI
jgi:hypothetical protein